MIEPILSSFARTAFAAELLPRVPGAGGALKVGGLPGSSGAVIRQCIAATRRGGVISMPGVYAGLLHGLLLGDAFDKGLSFRMGQTHVQHLMPELLERIGNGDLKPELIVSHHLALDDAARGYEMFDRKEDDCRKVVLTPGGPSPA